MNQHTDHSHDHNHHGHEHSLRQELLHHMPYAIFSLAIGFVLLSILYFIGLGSAQKSSLSQGYHILFHSFHYLHIVFATTGTFITFIRFSNRVFAGVILSIISPAIFCTLSDVALPALAGRFLGVAMKVHICFFSLPDLMNVLPFMLVGILNGLVLRRHSESSLSFFSVSSHFVHILISSLAALFYMVSYGFEAWPSMMGFLLLFLAIAVVIPCTISDVVVPMYFARRKRADKSSKGERS